MMDFESNYDNKSPSIFYNLSYDNDSNSSNNLNYGDINNMYFST